jgi:hypothetical protein
LTNFWLYFEQAGTLTWFWRCDDLDKRLLHAQGALSGSRFKALSRM